MIHGFKGKCVTTVEEWLIDYSLRTGNVVDVNPDLISMPIRFDGKEIDAFILDVIDNKLVIQLVLPMVELFDGESNRYATSYVRKLINSNEFLHRFNSEFVKRIQMTEVHTEDYVTNDKLWLLSHEEVNPIKSSLVDFRSNDRCTVFEMFKTIDLATYSQMLLRLNGKTSYGWWLRSSASSVLISSSRYVGFVNDSGYMNGYSHYTIDLGSLLPACTICWSSQP